MYDIDCLGLEAYIHWGRWAQPRLRVLEVEDVMEDFQQLGHLVGTVGRAPESFQRRATRAVPFLRSKYI